MNLIFEPNLLLGQDEPAS